VNKKFNSTFPFFWETMPTQEEVLDIVLLPEEKLEELQTPPVSRYARELKKNHLAVYNGML